MRPRPVTWDWEPGSYRAAAQLDRSWRVDEAGREEIDRRFYAIVADLVGAPAELIAPDGEIAWRSPATLWGRRVGTTDGAVNRPLRFPGQYHDDETGLDYNLARYYNADTASYLSPDPLGLAASPNHHGYVGNPLWCMDPLGLKGKKITRIFDGSEYDKHGSRAGSSSKGEVSRAPSNGQAALDRSIDMDPNNPAVTRRLGIDYENNEIVVLDRHREVTDERGNVTEHYHGHVQSAPLGEPLRPAASDEAELRTGAAAGQCLASHGLLTGVSRTRCHEEVPGVMWNNIGAQFGPDARSTL